MRERVRAIVHLRARENVRVRERMRVSTPEHKWVRIRTSVHVRPMLSAFVYVRASIKAS